MLMFMQRHKTGIHCKCMQYACCINLAFWTQATDVKIISFYNEIIPCTVILNSLLLVL